MERCAKFEKVSFSRFYEGFHAFRPEMTEEEIREVYGQIRLPERATAGSAGYDFFAPCDIVLHPKDEILIPTGIRVKMKGGYVLMLFPRSSLGFKYRLQLNNTVGIIDSDYFFAENEGHIFCRLTNDSNRGKVLELKKGTGMVQGIFVPFGITEDDEAEGQRTGGFGSTDRKQD